MTREQEERTDRLARKAAENDCMECGEGGTRSRPMGAKWWVCKLSRALGIESSGMVDVSGEIARRFERAYARHFRKEAGCDPW